MKLKNIIFFKSFFILLAVLPCFILAEGCCSVSGAAPASQKHDQKRIGLLITPQGLNDRGFNDLAFDGLQRAETNLNVDGILIEPSKNEDVEASLRFYLKQNFDAVIAAGDTYLETIRKLRKESPDTEFYILDSDVNEPGLHGITFRDDETSYLCGFIAASMSKTGKIGFIGAAPHNVLKIFDQAYCTGARSVNPNIEILSQYVSDDNSGCYMPEKAAEIASDMYRSGCDIIFPPAGRSALGVIASAVKNHSYVFGVDMNQDSLAPGLVLTSAMKRLDLIVVYIAKCICEDKKQDIKRSYGLAERMVSLTDFQLSFKTVGSDLIEKVNAARKGIIDGAIKTLVIEDNK